MFNFDFFIKTSGKSFVTTIFVFFNENIYVEVLNEKNISVKVILY